LSVVSISSQEGSEMTILYSDIKGCVARHVVLMST
jgi:hypothetical protein